MSKREGEVMASATAESTGVRSVDRALAVMSALEKAQGPQSLTDLSLATGLYKSAVLRLVQSLKNAGYIARFSNGKYSLGPTVFRLGAAYERLNPIREYIGVVLKNLVAEGSESASFHAPEGKDARICMMRVNSHHSTLDRISEGDILPLDRGATGTLIAAFIDMEDERLDEVRTAQFSVAVGGDDSGWADMAAAVFGANGQFRGALSLSGPAAHFTPDMIERWRRRITNAARDITLEMGGQIPVGNSRLGSAAGGRSR